MNLRPDRRARAHLLSPLALAAGFVFSACAPVAGGSGVSLNDSRLGVIKGTTAGIVLVEAPAAPASGAAPAAAAGGAAASSRWSAPPTGQPLRDATRLDSPSNGIPLPSAASAASGDARPKTGG